MLSSTVLIKAYLFLKIILVQCKGIIWEISFDDDESAMHANDLLTDWVKLMRQHTGANHDYSLSLSDKLRQELDEGKVAETVFGAAERLGLQFEARHAALELFERAAARLAAESREAGGLDRLGGVLVACVQLASKMNSMKEFVYPRDISQAFPIIS